MPKGGAAAPGSEAEKKKWGKNTHTKIREMIRVGKDASIDGEHVSTVMAEVIKYKQGSLTNAQIKALSDYVDSSSGLNGALRSREGDLSKFGPQGRASIEAIDSALRGTKNFALPLTVHRGIPAKVVAGKSVGDTFKDFAYSSTTFSKSVANGFGGATVLEISLPKGFKFISIPSTIEHGNKGSLQRREAEVILPRETVFRIKSIKTAKPTSSGFKGLTTIKVEAIASSIQGEAKTWKKVSAQPGAAVQPGGSVLPAAAMAAGEDLSKFIWKAGDIVWVEGGEDAFEPEDYIDDEEGEDAPE